ncbi:MAG: hypothetical protein NZ521_10360, partial [Flammeovirgaceae bacterium]|nr:hypothetical protein [Flammeovirgaceae bacterium]MDW8288624.1 hypothetical protein [Flammeovirgaceae bacterium]
TAWNSVCFQRWLRRCANFFEKSRNYPFTQVVTYLLEGSAKGVAQKNLFFFIFLRRGNITYFDFGKVSSKNIVKV